MGNPHVMRWVPIPLAPQHGQPPATTGHGITAQPRALPTAHARAASKFPVKLKLENVVDSTYPSASCEACRHKHRISMLTACSAGKCCIAMGEGSPSPLRVT